MWSQKVSFGLLLKKRGGTNTIRQVLLRSPLSHVLFLLTNLDQGFLISLNLWNLFALKVIWYAYIQKYTGFFFAETKIKTFLAFN